jgi:hypothetical protein
MLRESVRTHALATTALGHKARYTKIHHRPLDSGLATVNLMLLVKIGEQGVHSAYSNSGVPKTQSPGRK